MSILEFRRLSEIDLGAGGKLKFLGEIAFLFPPGYVPAVNHNIFFHLILSKIFLVN